MQNPTPKDLVWPVTRRQVRVKWDTDARAAGGMSGPPAHTMHMPYEPLSTPRVAVDAEGIRYPVAADLQPRLAESWTASPDFREWTITLRRNVRSHAGNDLMAEDVRWSWQRTYAMRGLGVWRSRRVAGLQTAEAIDVLDRSTVRFSLANPNPEFPQFFSFSSNMIIDSTDARAHADANDPWATAYLAKHTAGFGAFRVAGHDENTIALTARDDYYLGPPGINTVTQVAVDRREEALRMLDRGEANIALHLFPDELARYAGRPEFQTYRVRGSHAQLDFNWRQPHFDKQEIRHAIAYALPYERIIQQAYLGFARPNRSPVTNAAAHYTEDHWRYTTDPARARELLRAGGHPDGFATELYITPNRESLRVAEIVRQALKEIGILVEVRLNSPATERVPAPMRFRDECGHALNEAMYDLAHEYDPPRGMPAAVNDIDREWVNRLKAIRAAEAADQPALYHAVQRDIVEFAPSIPIAELQSGWVLRAGVDPWVLSPACLAVNTTVWGGHRWDMGAQ